MKLLTYFNQLHGIMFFTIMHEHGTFLAIVFSYKKNIEWQ